MWYKIRVSLLNVFQSGDPIQFVHRLCAYISHPTSQIIRKTKTLSDGCSVKYRLIHVFEDILENSALVS
jgi:hypothetical protein